MPLPFEASRLVVGYVGNRSDICTLCRVSKGFQVAAERALYNTLDLRDPAMTVTVCRMLASQVRLSTLVEALTIVAHDDGRSLPPDYWKSVAHALRRAHRLRFLNIYIDNGLPNAQAWIFRGCTFQISTLHCDLEWDTDLIQFLNRQHALRDMYILDYNDHVSAGSSETLLQPTSLPQLSVVECTFTEAANLLVPGRPISHLKTCLSSAGGDRKRAETALLISKITESARPLRALDLGDPAADEQSSLDLLTRMVNARVVDVRYLGTLALPVDGRQRLVFYSLLRRMPRLDCVELEISHWAPDPTSDAALRALAGELRMYCPPVSRVVFVCEFERFFVRIVGGTRYVDEESGTEMLWREA
ncbi:hypothetical protein NEOLEDRAFT_1070745 [Neolentinus lepideus HHB14362 ss-1]|uniref:F-box domain-containing protein n=1 Tax=Neolentinus lepideus HHB14362 ss-1 TaxID=1314782 RepID=A0A165QT00_9AGAM|nr:hypothetical protein NEOLEDRAFT_1070745 [Neolentinus lepideus HHB14362 ss-1]